jgi:hypothetical protein
MNLDEFKEVAPSLKEVENNGDERYKRKDGRFEFALYANDNLICKRNFNINGYIEGSMQSLDFKDEIDKIVGFIDDDLKSKTRTYLWYHHFPDNPEWEPELSEPLIDEGTFMLKLVVTDGGNEVISRSWDARYYPSYIRNNVDITNRLVKITKGETVYTYNRDRFFSDDTPVSGELYVLKHMIMGREDLIPIIQHCIYEVCSAFEGYYDNIAQYNTKLEYKTTKLRLDKDGNVVTKDETYFDAYNIEHKVYEHGKVKQIPVYDEVKGAGKVYYTNINWYNKKLEREWAAATKEKTDKYFDDLRGGRKKREKKTEE